MIYFPKYRNEGGISIIKMNREERMEQWRQRIKDYQRSGLSQKTWCEQHQFALSTFRYWNHRIKECEIELESLSDPIFARLPSESEVSQTEGTMPPVVFNMNGIRIELYPSCSREMMDRLIGVLCSHV